MEYSKKEKSDKSHIIETMGYDKAIRKEDRKRCEYLILEAEITKQTAGSGTQEITINNLKSRKNRDLPWHFSGRRDKWAYYLIESGFWKEMFCDDINTFKVKNIKKTLSHKLILTDILLNEFETAPLRGSAAYGSWGTPIQDVYMYSLLRKLFDCWETDKIEIQFSEEEWAWFYENLFGQNYRDYRDYNAEEIDLGEDFANIDDFLNQDTNDAEIETGIYANSLPIKELMSNLENIWIKKSKENLNAASSTIKQQNEGQRLQIKFQERMRSVMAGLHEHYFLCPLSMKVNVWGGEDSEKKQKRDLNGKHIPELTGNLFCNEKIDDNIWTSYQQIKNYLFFYREIKRRSESENFLEEYITFIYAMAYSVSLEPIEIYRTYSIYIFEKIFGPYLFKYEADIIYEVFCEKFPDFGKKGFKAINIDPPQLFQDMIDNYSYFLHKIFHMKSPFNRLCEVESHLKQIIMDDTYTSENIDNLVTTDDTAYNNIEYFLYYMKDELQYNCQKLKFATSFKTNYDNYYKKLMNTASKMYTTRRQTEETIREEFDEKKCKKQAAEHVAEMDGVYNQVLAWVIKSSWGVTENIKIRITDSESQ